jgi:hypothetical protein
MPARRGAATFVPYTTWVESGWASESAGLGTSPRKRSHRPVELTIAGPVADVMQYVVGVSRLAIGQQFEPRPD